MDKQISVNLAYSDSGCPLFSPSKGAKILIEIDREGGSLDPAAPKLMNVSGNKEGLFSLAAAILALAESTDCDHHIHLDDLHEEVIRTPQGHSLLLSKIPHRRKKQP